MGIFSKNKKQVNKDIIYSIKYTSFFEYLKFPIPTDYFFGIMSIYSLIESIFKQDMNQFYLSLIFFSFMIFLKLLMYFGMSKVKIQLTQEEIINTLGAQKTIPYKNIINFELDKHALIIKTKTFQNTIFNLKQSEIEQITRIIDSKIILSNNQL